MYGTVFNMRPIKGQEQKIQELFERWERERNDDVEGVIGGYLFTSSSRPGIMIGVAIFDSKETYMKNANNPAQDRWYRKLRSLLEDDPEWNDSEVILSAHRGLARGL